MNIYYICSRYRGNDRAEVEKHIEYAKELGRSVLLLGESVIIPHLCIAELLNDSDPAERSLGFKADFELLAKCDAVLVGLRFGVSEGMEMEIEQAKKIGIPIFYAME